MRVGGGWGVVGGYGGGGGGKEEGAARGRGEQVHSTPHLVVHYMGVLYRHSVFQSC